VTLTGGYLTKIVQAYEPILPTAISRYYGLLVGANGLPVGMITGNVTRLGRFTLELQLAAGRYALTGALDARGHFAGQIDRPALTPITLIVQLDFADTQPQLGGTISVDGETMSLACALAVYSPTNRSPAAGRHTLALPADPTRTDPRTYPFGHGYWWPK
jgi:hypothetical protein